MLALEVILVERQLEVQAGRNNCRRSASGATLLHRHPLHFLTVAATHDCRKDSVKTAGERVT